MITINKERFKSITGMDLIHFMDHILKGDSWGNFLKIASVLEVSSKRAVALKMNVDPKAEVISKIDFNTALLLCKEMKIITSEAFNFANHVRQVRNDLVHNGFTLNFDIEARKGTKYFKKYKSNITGFISIEGHDITTSEKEHFNTLVMGTCIFIGLISKSIYQDNWLEHLEKKESKS